MNGEKMKKRIAAILTCGILLAGGVTVFAGSKTANVNVGTTGVTAEIGFNGMRAYAKLSATANIYATMYGEAHFKGGSEPRKFSGRIEENSYGEISANCNGTIYMVSCDFAVTSADGYWPHTMYIN